jgi:hypothetical protein
MFIYVGNIRYLTTNDQEAGRLFSPSSKLTLNLVSKISQANADLVASQANVMQLCCALLYENLRTADDADVMQVCHQVSKVPPIKTHILLNVGCRLY